MPRRSRQLRKEEAEGSTHDRAADHQPESRLLRRSVKEGESVGEGCEHEQNGSREGEDGAAHDGSILLRGPRYHQDAKVPDVISKGRPVITALAGPAVLEGRFVQLLEVVGRNLMVARDVHESGRAPELIKTGNRPIDEGIFIEHPDLMEDPLVDERVEFLARLDILIRCPAPPLDPSTFRHHGECDQRDNRSSHHQSDPAGPGT